jgi:inner membrane protein
MDTLTHALSGALLALATAPKLARQGALSRRARIVAGAAAAAFPDGDFVLRAVDTLTYLNLHQGVTHSLVLLPAWALALAGLFAALTRGRYRWPAFYGIAAMGLAIHIGADLVTAYGTQLLAPVSATRYSWPLVFLIDPYFTAILAAGLTAGSLWPQRQSASVAFVVLAAYMGLTATLQQHAANLGRDHAHAARLDGAVSHALPQPLSPFHWLVIVEHGEDYYETRVDLAGGHDTSVPATAGWLARLAAGYAPPAAAVWTHHPRFGTHPSERALARAAFAHEALAPFRRFARFLALDHVEAHGDDACVWFNDRRFSLPALPPSFRYGLCRGGSDPVWRLARLRGAFHID